MFEDPIGAEFPPPHPSNIMIGSLVAVLEKRCPGLAKDWLEEVQRVEVGPVVRELRGPRLAPDTRQAVRHGSALARFIFLAITSAKTARRGAFAAKPGKVKKLRRKS